MHVVLLSVRMKESHNNRKGNKHRQADELLKKHFQAESSEYESLLHNDFENTESHNLLWNNKDMGKKEEILSVIKNGIDNKIAYNHKQKIIRLLVTTSSVAAAIMLIAGLFFTKSLSDKQHNILTVQTASVADSVILSDGTTVFLSPNSTFSYPEKFNREKRDVSLLKGNAFFKVTRNEKKPFTVTSGILKTKVLGTSFSVHLNKDDYYVVVHTGKVNVSSETESIDILPSQEAIYSKTKDRLSKNIVNNQELKPWYNSDITLTNQSIETIFKIIEQKYGIDSITIAPELLQQKATVFIEENAPLKTLIDQINYITNLKFKFYDGIITCGNSTGPQT